ILQSFTSGGLQSPFRILTFSAFFHTMRLFGGQVGVAVMTSFIAEREKLHSNLLGLHVQAGDWVTEHVLRGVTAGVSLSTSSVAERETLHSNLLGLHVQAGDWVTEHVLRGVTAGVSAKSSGVA